MTTPETLPLHLYVPDSSLRGYHLGQIRITGVDAGQPGPQGLRLTFGTNVAGGADRWLDLRAEVWSNRPGGRRYGAIDIGHDGLPKLGQPSGSTHWTWRLAQGDLEAIEEDRSEAADAPVGFIIQVAGGIVLDGQPWRVTGEAPFSVPVADWHGLLVRLGFMVWPTTLALEVAALTSHPAWGEARQRLSTARRHLALGDDEAALAAAYREFERVGAGQPYRDESWQSLAVGSVEPKRRDMRRLVAAHAMYLNRLGRHLNPDTGAPGEQAEVGVNHWEAATLLATSQLLLATVIRHGAAGRPVATA